VPSLQHGGCRSPVSSLDSGAAKTVVGNPGAIAEMTPLAAGLARAGALRAFLIPITDQLPTAACARRLRLFGIGRRIERELNRREVPCELHGRITHAATPFELAFVISQRTRLLHPARSTLLSLRNRAFDKRLASAISTGDCAVVATSGAALKTFQRARELGITTFLEYPIAHHSFSERLLREEAALRPEFARTLQSHSFSRRRRKCLEAEIELADYIFVFSSFHSATFVARGIPSTKLILVPLGVDSNLFVPLERRAQRAFRMIFVGQIGQRKGLSYLIDAVELLSRSFEVELVLVGSVVGTAEPWASRPHVRHIPHVARRELPELYADADAFVLPSLVEGFALTALEAMACGLPVVVSTHTFGRDLIADGLDGFVVPIRDTSALTERLAALASSRDLRESMGRAARQRAEEFTWTKYGDTVAAEIAARIR
jgi:alpha-maltose-1-phosphate synthase